MIVQAISLLDDLDKELNNYVMRCREWYGWHFPELGKIVTDNLAYAKTVKTMGKGYYDIMLFFTALEQGTQDFGFFFFHFCAWETMLTLFRGEVRDFVWP